MTKVKSFEFMVNCFNGSFTQREMRDGAYCYSLEQIKNYGVSSPEEVDETINNFIHNKKVVSINDHYYTSSRHNNARQDTIIRAVTIIYEEK